MPPENQLDSNQHLHELQQMKNLMERSSRFISLSGLSGVFVGAFALIGEAIVLHRFQIGLVNHFFNDMGSHMGVSWNDFDFFFGDALLVLVCSILAASLLSWRNARKKRLRMWDAAARRLLINIMIPLSAGGLFCLLLMYHGLYILVAPCTMIFYGLALVHAAKYTLNDLRFPGMLEIALGLAGCFFPAYQLLFWAIGFGVLHIMYGIVMYFKYER